MWYFVTFVLLGFLITVAPLGRRAWRLWHGDEEFDAGGSMGDQLLGRWNRIRPQ